MWSDFLRYGGIPFFGIHVYRVYIEDYPSKGVMSVTDNLTDKELRCYLFHEMLLPIRNLDAKSRLFPARLRSQSLGYRIDGFTNARGFTLSVCGEALLGFDTSCPLNRVGEFAYPIELDRYFISLGQVFRWFSYIADSPGGSRQNKRAGYKGGVLAQVTDKLRH